MTKPLAQARKFNPLYLSGLRAISSGWGAPLPRRFTAASLHPSQVPGYRFYCSLPRLVPWSRRQLIEPKDLNLLQQFKNHLQKGPSGVAAKEFLDHFLNENTGEMPTSGSLNPRLVGIFMQAVRSLPSEEERIAIARELVKSSSAILSHSMKSFNITDQSIRDEIAVSMVNSRGFIQLFHYIDNFELSEDVFVYVLKEGLQKGFCFDVDQIELINSIHPGLAYDAFISSLRLIIKSRRENESRGVSCGWTLESDLKNWMNKIPSLNFSEEQKLSIGRLIFQEVRFSDSIKILHLFEIKEASRYELAKEFTIDRDNSSYVPEFNLEENYRYLLAKEFAGKKNEYLSNYIADYKLTPEHRYEIAKILAKNKKSSLSEYIEKIKKFELSEQERFEIAKIFVENDPGVLIWGFDHFQLGSEDCSLLKSQLAESAPKLARSHPGVIPKLIRFLNCTPEERYSLAKLVAESDPALLAEDFRKYQIIDEAQRYELALLILQGDEKGASRCFENFCLNELHLVEFWGIFARQALGLSESSSKRIISDIQKLINKSHNQEQKKVIADRFIEVLRSLPTEEEQARVLLEDPVVGSLFVEICAIRQLSLAKYAITALDQVLANPEERASLLCLGAQNSGHLLLSALFLVQSKIDPTIGKQLLQSLQPKYYKNGQVLTPLNELLASLSSSLQLSPEQKQKLLSILLQAPQKQKGEKDGDFNKRLDQHRTAQKKLVIFFSALIHFQRFDLLQNIQDKKEINSCLNSLIQKAFQFSLISEEQLERFCELLSKTRVPYAFFSYVVRLSQLDFQEKRVLTSFAVSTLARSLLDQTFPEIRYDLTKSKHLDKLFGTHPHLLERWRTPIDPTALLAQKLKEEEKTPQEITTMALRLALQQSHLGTNQQTDFPFLSKQCQESWSFEFLEQSKVAGGRVPTIEQMIEAECLALFDPALTLEEIKNRIEKLITLVPQDVQFHRDLADLLKQLSSPKFPLKNLSVVVDSDQFDDLLLMGTEVVGSCQHIEASPSLNQCLLAYLLDGKNRVVVVKNKENKILARSVLRILWDDQKQQPALFMERIYTALGADPLRSLVRAGCIQKAQQMGLCLYCETNTSDVESSLSSLASSFAPFEYVDALRGQLPNGQYTLNCPMGILYQP